MSKHVAMLSFTLYYTHSSQINRHLIGLGFRTSKYSVFVNMG